MLQTFDISTSRQIARQALARNATTSINVTPTGQRVVHPDVTHLQVSHDGEWLATVDSWTKPEKDLVSLHPHCDDPVAKSMWTETHIRFWAWKEGIGSWEMGTRVDEPHLRGAASILGLAANPTRTEFSTLGSDGYLRIWHPRLRNRSGLAVRSKSGDQLYTWTCTHSLQPETGLNLHQNSSYVSAAVAYSEDGSTIAASWSSPTLSSPSIHFIASGTGSVRLSQPNLVAHGDSKFAFSGSKLLVLSDKFHIWDTINAKLVLTISPKSKYKQSTAGYLVANSIGQTVALAVNPSTSNAPAQVAVFDAKAPEKILYQGTVHGHVTALLPIPRATGYVVIDGEARYRHLRPCGTRQGTEWQEAVESKDVMRGLDDIFGSHPVGGPALLTTTGDSNDNFAYNDPDQEPARKSLETILSQQALSTSMPVSELFEQVAGLFLRAPVAVS